MYSLFRRAEVQFNVVRQHDGLVFLLIRAQHAQHGLDPGGPDRCRVDNLRVQTVLLRD